MCKSALVRRRSPVRYAGTPCHPFRSAAVRSLFLLPVQTDNRQHFFLFRAVFYGCIRSYSFVYVCIPLYRIKVISLFLYKQGYAFLFSMPGIFSIIQHNKAVFYTLPLLTAFLKNYCIFLTLVFFSCRHLLRLSCCRLFSILTGFLSFDDILTMKTALPLICPENGLYQCVC